MSIEKVSILISSCEKFSDLWEAYFYFFHKNWADCDMDIYLLTDSITEKSFDNVCVISAGEGAEITTRLQVALCYIKTDYILFTLDDYFLNQKINSNLLYDDLKIMEENKIDYMSLYNKSKKALKNRKAKLLPNTEKTYQMDNYSEDYIISLYASFWRREFMVATLKDVNGLNVWQYEVALTRIARELDAKCTVSLSNEFPILDVIRKGKILRKAHKYFKKHPIYNGDRKVMKFYQEWILSARTFLRRWLPRRMFFLIKSIMRNFGYSFFSDEI